MYRCMKYIWRLIRSLLNKYSIKKNLEVLAGVMDGWGGGNRMVIGKCANH